MYRRILALSLMALLVAFAVGCKKDGKVNSKDGEVGKDVKGGDVEYRTPEEAFDAFKTAARNKDYKALANCWTPESQEQVLAVMLTGVTVLRGRPEEARKNWKPVTDVLEKHGVTERGPEETAAR
jgi:hypothetical protein